jgi:hypothetical protein
MVPRVLTCHPTIKVTGADETFPRSTQSLLLRAGERREKIRARGK